MSNYEVEIRVQHPTGKIGIDCTVNKVLVNARSHEEAKSIAEIRHRALVLSTVCID